ncbi:hypothetical protein BN1183_CJ_02940 [Pantoea ananatis]|nr:hypothetical protein BN1183_CJ_02940 [Pantoea ananatis]
MYINKHQTGDSPLSDCPARNITLVVKTKRRASARRLHARLAD